MILSDLSEKIDIGLNLKLSYLDEIIKLQPNIGFFEVIAENLFDQSHALEKVLKIRQDYPVHLHCVGMNLAGDDSLNVTYLSKISALIEKIEPRIVSDHLCFQKYNGVSHFDLLPFPLHASNLEKCVSRLDQIQSFLSHRVFIENLAYYIEFNTSTISESQFISTLCKKTGTKILLDLNNIHMNALNHGGKLSDYINEIDPKLIGQIHIAGGEKVENIWVDTHGSLPKKEVVKALSLFELKGLPVCYERDQNTPDFIDSVAYLEKLKIDIAV